jgi:hypothetical protein
MCETPRYKAGLARHETGQESKFNIPKKLKSVDYENIHAL